MVHHFSNLSSFCVGDSCFCNGFIFHLKCFYTWWHQSLHFFPQIFCQQYYYCHYEAYSLLFAILLRSQTIVSTLMSIHTLYWSITLFVHKHSQWHCDSVGNHMAVHPWNGLPCKHCSMTLPSCYTIMTDGYDVKKILMRMFSIIFVV